jgi:hypothetical protein
MGVLHRPRVAWEGARVFVAAADADAYYWLGDLVGQHLGVMYQLRLAETRIRLRAGDVSHAETGVWRAYLDDLLQERPELTTLVHELVAETSSRLDR